jgi:hypothetical protein
MSFLASSLILGFITLRDISHPFSTPFSSLSIYPLSVINNKHFLPFFCSAYDTAGTRHWGRLFMTDSGRFQRIAVASFQWIDVGEISIMM